MKAEDIDLIIRYNFRSYDNQHIAIEQAASDIAKLWEDNEVGIIEQYQGYIDKCHAIIVQMKEKQPCGHEGRFTVSADEGTHWCALCELEGLSTLLEALRVIQGRVQVHDG